MTTLKVSFFDRTPPLAVLAVPEITRGGAILVADASATFPKADPPRMTLVDNANATTTEITGITSMMRYMARIDASQSLYGATPLESVEIDSWLEYAASHLVSGPHFPSSVAALESYLASRTFFVGYKLSIADLAIWGALAGCTQFDAIKKSLCHVNRFMDMMSATPELHLVLHTYDTKTKKKVAAEVTDAQTGLKKGEGGSFDINLPNAEKGKVVTRFPPEPSGYLHLGHAKAALLNEYFARHYEGQLIVRFDDTNPTKEKDEYVENILADIATMGIKFDRLTYTSDYFPQLIQLGDLMIRAGLMYADDTPVDLMREQRTKCIASSCRDKPVAESLAIFEEMKVASELGQTYCMRLKIDYQSENGCLRDPVAFRVNLKPHHRTGELYKMYPTYDFACPFVDAIEGVTHALRTSEYKDREAQFYWCLDAYKKVWPGGLPHVHIWDYARLNFIYTVLSKRKLQWFVDQGRVEGWNDARFPTVQGIMRRGLKTEALREFILSQGASKNITYQEWDKIWAVNRKIIDPISCRYTAIDYDHAVTIHLVNGPVVPETSDILRHKKNPELGHKVHIKCNKIMIEQVDAQLLQEKEEVTLMDWGNCFVRNIQRNADGKIVSMEGELNPGGDVKKTKWKLTWLPSDSAVMKHQVLRLVDFDYLITKKKIDEGDDFESLVNPYTRKEWMAHGDVNLRSVKKGEIFQLERKGYFIVDEIRGDEMVLFAVPDSKQREVGVFAPTKA